MPKAHKIGKQTELLNKSDKMATDSTVEIPVDDLSGNIEAPKDEPKPGW